MNLYGRSRVQAFFTKFLCTIKLKPTDTAYKFTATLQGNLHIFHYSKRIDNILFICETSLLCHIYHSFKATGCYHPSLKHLK